VVPQRTCPRVPTEEASARCRKKGICEVPSRGIREVPDRRESVPRLRQKAPRRAPEGSREVRTREAQNSAVMQPANIAKPVSRQSPGKAEPFQELLLELSSFAEQESDPSELVARFCHETRRFLGASGTYYWKVTPDEKLVAIHAEGHMAGEFASAALQPADIAMVMKAVRQRRTYFENACFENAGFDKGSEARDSALAQIPDHARWCRGVA